MILSIFALLVSNVCILQVIVRNTANTKCLQNLKIELMTFFLVFGNYPKEKLSRAQIKEKCLLTGGSPDPFIYEVDGSCPTAFG